MWVLPWIAVVMAEAMHHSECPDSGTNDPPTTFATRSLAPPVPREASVGPSSTSVTSIRSGSKSSCGSVGAGASSRPTMSVASVGSLFTSIFTGGTLNAA